MNFAKLFLPFKKAYEIEQKEFLDFHQQTIQDDWKDEHEDSDNEVEEEEDD